VYRVVVARDRSEKLDFAGCHEAAIVSGIPHINFVKGEVGDLGCVGHTVLLIAAV
jgi:hypothetical protein